MRSVYVYNSDFNNDVFTSLLMVDLNSFNIPFNNIKTTKEIYYDNIIVYIPKEGIANDSPESILESIKTNSYMFDFRHTIFCFGNTEDYKVFASIFNNYYNYNIHYYISIALNTLLASIISFDCYNIINARRNVKTRVLV